MPNVIGKTSTEAKALLEKDLTVLIEPQTSTAFPLDVVISTTPKPGESVMQGTEVTMVVSIGPGPLAQGGPKEKKKMIARNTAISEDYL